jgi:hypothetical protein
VAATISEREEIYLMGEQVAATIGRREIHLMGEQVAATIGRREIHIIGEQATAIIREQVATAIGDRRHERETAATVDKRTQGLPYQLYGTAKSLHKRNTVYRGAGSCHYKRKDTAYREAGHY